jgi:TolB-like protein
MRTFSKKTILTGLTALLLVTVTTMNAAAQTIGEKGQGGGIIYAVNGKQVSEVAVLDGTYNWAGAKLAATSYTGGGVTGWRAPMDADLQAINKSGVIKSGNYWSSLDTNALNAHDIRFGSGDIGTKASKSSAKSALAVRTYTQTASATQPAQKPAPATSAPAPSTPSITLAQSTSNGITLDEAVSQAAKQLEGSLDKNIKVAVLSFVSEADALSRYVVEELTGALVEGKKFTVVDRARLDLIRKEMEFQVSGEVSDESMQSIGQKLGAQAIISGNFMNIGTGWRFQAFAISVETAQRAASYRTTVNNDAQVAYLMSVKNAPAAAAQTTTPAQKPGAGSSTQPQTAAPAAPAAEAAKPAVNKVYKIGDIGPAGGLIFYDKGKESDGWRYLEVAPKSTEAKAKWGPADRELGTVVGIGTGKGNTDRIVRYLKARGESGMAAQICAELKQGGYTDWFLPSKDELDLLYKLWDKDFEFGTFTTDWYWTSSEGGAGYSWKQNFSNGQQFGSSDYYGTAQKDKMWFVRAVRQF